MMNFMRMIEKMKFQFKDAQTQKEIRQKKGGPIQIDIMYNKSQKDIGVLIKLNGMMKRLELIKYMQGNWKPTNKKYLNMTD